MIQKITNQKIVQAERTECNILRWKSMGYLSNVTGCHFYIKIWRQIWKVVWVPRYVKDFRIHSLLGEKSLDVSPLLFVFCTHKPSQTSFWEKSQFKIYRRNWDRLYVLRDTARHCRIRSQKQEQELVLWDRQERIVSGDILLLNN